MYAASTPPRIPLRLPGVSPIDFSVRPACACILLHPNLVANVMFISVWPPNTRAALYQVIEASWSIALQSSTRERRVRARRVRAQEGPEWVRDTAAVHARAIGYGLPTHPEFEIFGKPRSFWGFWHFEFYWYIVSDASVCSLRFVTSASSSCVNSTLSTKYSESVWKRSADDAC